MSKMDWSDITLVSATFNRHDFTKNMIISFFKTVGNLSRPPSLMILDNSTELPFAAESSAMLQVINNRNFLHTPNYNQPSKNHASSLSWLFLSGLIKTKYVMLCDNDILFKLPIINLIETRSHFDAIGEVGWDRVPPKRLYPYFCIFDLDFTKKHGIKYFDETRCMVQNARMDTGCSFYADLVQTHARIKQVRISDYIVHLKGGTLRNKPITLLHM